MLRLNLSGQRPFCDGLHRRSFLRVGGLAMGGLALPTLLRAEAASAGGVHRHKAVIMIYLAGGPPHLDMFDMKPHAPAEIRGEFRPIQTNVPGIEICELFPRMATMMDKFAIIRSLDGCIDRHDPHQIMSGLPSQGDAAKWPCIGSFVSKVQGSANDGVPPFIGLSPNTRHRPWGNSGEPHFLGPQHAPFRPDGQGLADMILGPANSARLPQRATLLKSLDHLRRHIDALAEYQTHDAYTSQALEILASPKLVSALDIETADPQERDRYGRGDKNFVDDGPWRWADQFLTAFRLVRAGARVVTLAFSRWDWHSANFSQGRRDMPLLDQALTALVTDIHAHGLENDVAVVVWGEFGRTPKINKDAGRDHWPSASFALLAGGGMNMGQVIGATDKFGERPIDRRIHPQQVLGMLYRSMGIDVDRVTVADHAGRPQYLVERRDPIPELA